MTILLDANVFLRALAKPPDPAIHWMHDEARELFRKATRGEALLTTTDAIVAEVAFILTSKAHYGLSVDDACTRMRLLVGIRNLRFHGKRNVMRALDLWPQHPRLDFPDVLLAVIADLDSLTLASFDRGFDRFDHLDRYPWQGNARSNGATGGA
jgi:predicted nucleic acid-binding protein